MTTITVNVHECKEHTDFFGAWYVEVNGLKSFGRTKHEAINGFLSVIKQTPQYNEREHTFEFKDVKGDVH